MNFQFIKSINKTLHRYLQYLMNLVVKICGSISKKKKIPHTSPVSELLLKLEILIIRKMYFLQQVKQPLELYKYNSWQVTPRYYLNINLKFYKTYILTYGKILNITPCFFLKIYVEPLVQCLFFETTSTCKFDVLPILILFIRSWSFSFLLCKDQ